MIGSFFLVALLSWKNRIMSRVRRMKQPRYLFSALAGLTYFGWIIFRNSFWASQKAPRQVAGVYEILLACGGIVVTVILLFPWALPDSSGGLEFTEGEIQFLFPAPLTRAGLILYKVVRTQPQIVVSAILMTVFGLHRDHFIGAWAVLTALNMYFVMTALGRARLALTGIGFAKRLIAVLLVVVAIGTVVATQYRSIHFSKGMTTGPPLIRMLLAPLNRMPLQAIFYIPRFFALALFPPTIPQQAVAIAALCLMSALFFGVATKIDVSFQEGSIAASKKRANRLSRRSGQSAPRVRSIRAPFRLPENAPAEVAIFWKNIVGAARVTGYTTLGLRVFAIGFAGLIIFERLRHSSGYAVTLGAICMLVAGTFAAMGPFLLRNDLRLDLRRLDLLKTFPMKGENLVASEIAAPLAIIALLEIGFYLAGVIQLRLGGMTDLFLVSPQFAVIAILLIVPINAIQLIIQNAIVIVLPGWSTLSKEESRGFVAMGQHMLVFIGHFLAVALAALPASVVLVPSFWIVYHFFPGDSAAFALATLPGIAVLVVEIFLAIRFLGEQFDAIDPSNDLQVAGD